MSNFLEKIKEELYNLEVLISEIEYFINHEEFNNLSNVQKDLLYSQQAAMTAYFGILRIRYFSLGNKKKQ